MSDQKDLHLRRLHDSLNNIQVFLKEKITPYDSQFQTWRDRTLHSLNELFGRDHDYARRFSLILFRKPKVRIVSLDSGGGIREKWTQEDQTIFEDALTRASDILTDALEEFPALVTKTEPVATSTPSKQPQIVVNVTNVLSQSTHVELSQVLSNLESLGLSPEQLSQAKTHAHELAEEVQGEQRWPILAKSLEALKSMGKSVYENVALPLLLEMLRKQTGLNS